MIDVTDRVRLEDRLREAQKLEAVGHLAGGIAHDINNALTAVGGFTEMDRAAAEDPTVKADARVVAEGVERASRLTRQLLAFAQRSVLKPQVIDAADFLGSIRGDLQRLVGSDVDVVVRSDGQPAPIHVDPGQFEQAILRLAERALDAMPGGGILTISIDRRPPGARTDAVALERPAAIVGPAIVVTVADTGRGLEPELREQAFEPYGASDEGGPGGLALAMVHGFVAQSGGEIELRSEAGAGTTVEIRLPEAIPPSAIPGPAVMAPSGLRDQGDAGAGPPGPAITVAADRADGGDETILVIEDEPAVAAFCQRVLAARGYTVVEATDGPAAIDIARRHPGTIRLILSDVLLPGMRGPEAVARIRAFHPEAAVLYASAFTAGAIVEDGVLPEGVALIEKPFRAEPLARRVREILDSGATAPTGSS